MQAGEHMIVEEDRERGTVDWPVFAAYFKAYGFVHMLVVVALAVAAGVLIRGAEVYLSYFSSHVDSGAASQDAYSSAIFLACFAGMFFAGIVIDAGEMVYQRIRYGNIRQICQLTPSTEILCFFALRYSGPLPPPPSSTIPC